ncbi:MAG: CorA family divalent cation transporter [Promethearchaeota archaeon]
MIKYYVIEGEEIKQIKNPQDMNALTWCDINFEEGAIPEDELQLASTMFRINIHDLKDVMDITERPRYNYDLLLKNQFLLLRGIKIERIEIDGSFDNPTIPIGIFYTSGDKIVTVHSIASTEFQNVISTLNMKRIKEPMLLFLEFIQVIFNRLDRVSYKISLEINKIQKKISQVRNPEKIDEPFKLNAYMIFFNAAMMGNYNALQAFMNKNKKLFDSNPFLYEKVDDLKIDIEQIYQFTSIYRDQVRNLVEQANNMINNNLNNVFKVVGSISLILSIPTLISGFYGMNVAIPGATGDKDYTSFWLVTVFSFVVSFFTWLLFRKLRWL